MALGNDEWQNCRSLPRLVLHRHRLSRESRDRSLSFLTYPKVARGVACLLHLRRGRAAAVFCERQIQPHLAVPGTQGDLCVRPGRADRNRKLPDGNSILHTNLPRFFVFPFLFVSPILDCAKERCNLSRIELVIRLCPFWDASLRGLRPAPSFSTALAPARKHFC